MLRYTSGDFTVLLFAPLLRAPIGNCSASSFSLKASVAEINIGEWDKNIASVMFPTTQSLKKRRSQMTLLTH